jgi:hypothetical protein
MVISYLKGGLGNFLFQIAHGYSLSLDNNVGFGIDLNKIWVVHNHWSEYMSNIFRHVPTVTTPPQVYNYTYESLTYKPTPYVDNIFLDGYYQSEKYFINNKQKILDLFKIDKSSFDYLEKKYPNIVNNNNTCSIHVRRGDFLKIDFYNKLNMDYYNKTMDIAGRDKHFVIFSNDIQWCKENFIDVNATFIENEKDYIDIYLMSLCKDNITSNSTFSWWGSYLNQNPNKRVYTPRTWFIHSHSNEDILPSEWIKID